MHPLHTGMQITEAILSKKNNAGMHTDFSYITGYSNKNDVQAQKQA